MASNDAIMQRMRWRLFRKVLASCRRLHGGHSATGSPALFTQRGGAKQSSRMSSTGYYTFVEDDGPDGKVDRVSTIQRYRIATVVAVAVCVGALLVTGTSLSPVVLPASIGLQTTALCPTVQQGIDYVGNDIANIAGSGAADCCTKCSQRTGCGAFTWSNYAGGTCWLKSGKGAINVTAGVISAAVSKPTMSTTATCPSVQQGVDYFGNDIENVPGTGAADCCTKCNLHADCGAFTWSNYNGGTCWLKRTKGAITVATGVVSAVLVRTPTPTATTVKPTSTAPTTTKPATTVPATTTPAPTTTKPATTVPATTTPAPTTIKPPATTAPATAMCPSMQQGVDYIGNDIENVPGTGAADCCTKCNLRSRCGAFTWSNYNGGTCWLKSAKGATKAATGMVSAVLVRTPSPTSTTVTPPPTTPAQTTTKPATTKPATTVPATTTPAPTTTKPPATTTPAPTTTAPATTTPAPTSSSVCPTLEQGVDYIGNDLLSVTGSSASDCCSKCNQIVGCAAFTYSAGTCYLKSGKGTTTTKAGVVSAQVMKKPVAAIYGGVANPSQPQLSDGNPTAYPSNGCALPNWISKNGKIYATGPNGFQEAIAIKGINWFGMETSATVPLGLWANNETGSTLYSIAAFLSRNKFNSVRLPLCMDSLLQNIVPDRSIVNEAENAAIKVDTYMNLLKSLIKGLGYRGITVLLDLHTLTTSDTGLLWYNDKISEARYLQGVDLLTSNLCSNEYFNVIGVDLKNEPASATWGDGSAKDFRAAAVRIGNRMLSGCSKWLALVEGISEFHSFTASTGKTYYFNDWWGGGLAKARQYPVTLSLANKLVWAPHYYPPSVYPIEYYYGDGYSELSDAHLKENIKGTFDLMFGYLAQDTSGPAILLGEFGGLYTSDLHPKKTLQRSVSYTIELAMRPGFSGGYIWSLNPESAYEYNPGNTQGFFQEGLLKSSWRAANEPFLTALTAMDRMADLKPLPCYKW